MMGMYCSGVKPAFVANVTAAVMLALHSALSVIKGWSQGDMVVVCL
jgi:hypothetical protein